MSALGHKQTFGSFIAMSAIPRKRTFVSADSSKMRVRFIEVGHFAGKEQLVQSTKNSEALPRGLRHCSRINELRKSGTLNRYTESLGFLRQVSHQKKRVRFMVHDRDVKARPEYGRSLAIAERNVTAAIAVTK